MHPATIRRLLVFGVCALGVGALYLVPTVAGTPAQLGGSPASREPQSAPRPASYVTQPSDDSDALSAPVQPAATVTATVTTPREGAPTSQHPPRSRRERPATAQSSDRAADDEAPSTVADLTFPSVSTERLTIRWTQATDNVGVAGYRVWLNGFHVADSTALEVTIPWFNDGSRQQVVQVRAVDADGNQSEQAPARLVERPAASPTPAPTASAPTPEATPSTPSQSPDGDATIADGPG